MSVLPRLCSFAGRSPSSRPASLCAFKRNNLPSPRANGLHLIKAPEQNRVFAAKMAAAETESREGLEVWGGGEGGWWGDSGRRAGEVCRKRRSPAQAGEYRFPICVYLLYQPRHRQLICSLSPEGREWGGDKGTVTY